MCSFCCQNKGGKIITYMLKNQTIIVKNAAMCTGAIQCVANFSNQTHVWWELASWNHDHKLSNKFHNFSFQSKYFGAILPVCDTPSIPIKNSSKMSKYHIKCLIFLPFLWLLSNNISTDVTQLTDWRDKEEL